MPTTSKLSTYVTGLSDAGTLDGTEVIYLASNEKTTVSSVRQAMNVKVVNIGDWDMDATASVSITHGVADYAKIRDVSVMIIPDAATSLISLETCDSTGLNAGYVGQVQSTTISLSRVVSGQFDSTDYDSTSFNRGYVTILYID